MKAFRLLLSLTFSILWLSSTILQADTEATQAVADRYEQLLVRTPQGGPSFDRVVDWYSSDGGGPDALQKRWKAAAESDATNRRSYLILQGLLAERLRRTAEARALYAEALALEGEKLQAAKPLAALEATEGNFAAAATAYKEALAVESLRPVDRLELMRSLALLYQRAFDNEKALSVWRDAVAAFPDDQYVLEEAGEAFLASGEYADANKTFSRLREVVSSDPFQQISASLRLARTLNLQEKTPEAVEIYLKALSETSEGSWINREVRAQIEALFRRKDDLPGLLSFYEKRLETSPQDYASLVAQAAVLEDLGRVDEALECTRKAASLAPDNIDLRLGLIRRLTAQGKTDEALKEAVALCKPADAPARALVVLGDLNWTLFTQTKDEKFRSDALAAWKRLAPDDSRDVARISQFAEILTSHELFDDAFAQWQRIVAMAPDLPEPRQRLAEIYLKRGDKTAAADILAELVEGDRAQATNFVSLIRLQERLELAEPARETARKGIELFPTNFDLLNIAWRQATEARDAEGVTKLFPTLWQNSPSDFYAGEAEKKYVLFLDSAGKAKETREQLARRLEKEALSPAEIAILFRLALAQQEEGTAKKALAVIKAQNDAVRSARLTYEYAQVFGSSDDQIAALEALAAAEPRMAGESLRAAARLQADTGRTEAALKTIAQLLDRTPGDVSLYTLHAEIATRDGKVAEAVDRLRKAIRQVDDTTTIRLQLAALLDTQGRTAEAARVLQEAFEAEQAEGRRLEIFRRQIEVAMRAGTIENLIAELREKQLREQSGARYGTYLAEIFIMQGDLLAAREELTRSLGRSPDNPAAVTKLLDLAERGGDQQEALRLAKILAELAPSAQNRASYLSKLFDSGEIATAQAELDRVRPEILKDPLPWSAMMTAMRKAGLEEQSDALVGEIASTAAPGIAQYAEMSRLRLMQRDYAAAKESLWQVIKDGDLAASLKAVADDKPSNIPRGYPPYWGMMMPFQQLASEAQNSMTQLFVQNRGYYSTRMSFGLTPGATKATPEQREQVRALFTLAMLANSQDESATFFSKLSQILEEQNTPRRLRILIQRILGDTNGVATLIREQAEDPKSDLEADRFIVSFNQQQPDPALKDAVTRITDRVRKADPKFDFEQSITDISMERMKSPDPKSAAARADLHKKVETLLNHPGLAQSPQGRIQLASLAALAGDFPLAFRMIDEAAAAQAATSTVPVVDPQINATRANIVAQAILADDPDADKRLEEYLKTPTKTGSQASMYYGPYGMGFSRSMNQLAQATSELAAGDAAFTFPFFRQLAGVSNEPADTARLQKWFGDRATKQEFDTWNIGAFYADWVAGKRDEALKRIENIHARNPTPRTSALLFEAYEKLNQPEKALVMAETAAMQEGETIDIRNLRTIRLLRSAGKTEEAKALAERLARSRVSYAVREQLANELNLIGIPPTKYPNLSLNTMGQRATRDQSEQIRLQVSKLAEDKKIDEAERIARQYLQRPLPSRQDYQASNTRQNLISLLKSMERLDRVQAPLQERLTKDPSDLDAAIRLAETNWNDSSAKSGTALLEAIKANPKRVPGLSYAFQLLSRNSETRGTVAEALSTLIRTNPDFLAASGLQMYELTNYASTPEGGAILADTIASLNDENYARLFYPSRLARDLTEIGFISQLAEFSAKAGKTDQAIALLKRNRSQSMQYLDAGLPSLLRLAELQEAQGDKAGAIETMKALIEAKTQQGYPLAYGSQTLANVFSNLMLNNARSGGGTDLILRTARLAEQTGMLDQLLASLDTPNPNVRVNAVSPSLQVRTILKKPGIEKEWREITLSKQPLGMFSLPMLTAVIPALAEQKDAKELVPALLRKIPESGYYRNADYSLAALADALPLLTAYKEDPSVKKFITTLISQAMADPNGTRNLLFSENYPRAVIALLVYGLTDEAQKLFDLTAGERAGQNYGNQNVFKDLENRLAAARGAVGGVDVVCAGLPIGPDRLRINWKASVTSGQPEGDDSVSLAVWSNESLPIPKSKRPVEIEILAGPNPAALERVGRVANPGVTGSIEAKVTSPLGLLMARWKLADGTTSSGSLTAYLTGENLIPDNGVPSQKSPAGADVFQTSLPGPGGEKSAVRYQTTSPSSQATVELGAISVDNTPGLIAFTAWIQTDQAGRMSPRPEFQIIRGKDRTNTEGAYISAAASGQWRQVVKIWSTAKSGSSHPSLGEGVTEIKFRINMNAYSGYNSQFAIVGSWDGVQLVRLPAEASANSEESRKLLAAAQTAASKKDYKAAADALLAALRLDPYTTLQQSPATIVDAFKNSNRLGELYTQVSTPALFVPNPLRNNQPTINNAGLIDLLAREALAADAHAEAKKWFAQIQTAPLNENLRLILQAAALRQNALSDPAKANTAEILAAFGFQQKKVNANRLRRVWYFGQQGNPTQTLLGLLDDPKKAGEALTQLKGIQVPVDLNVAKMLLEAWLTATTDPTAALSLFNQAAEMRQNGRNTAGVDSTAERDLLIRIASAHPNPADVIAGVNTSLAKSRSDENYRQRQLVETLYALAKAETPNRNAYVGAWADAELGAIKRPNYSFSRERIRELAKRLEETAEWDRLDELLALAKSTATFSDANLQRELAQLKNTVALGKGDISLAWPVAWCEPGTDSRDVTIHWEWNQRNVDPNQGDFDTAISVAQQPVIAKISGQTLVEVFFGELVSTMKSLGVVEGDNARGSLRTTLPTGNGFMRVVSTVNGKQITGPVTAIVSGKRVYPPNGTSLKDLLSSGSETIAPALISDAGKAPDDSPALRLGKAGSSRRLAFAGPAFTVQPGKFYVSRAWIRRAGSGSGVLSSEFKAVKTSTKGSLNMLLTEEQETVGPWVLYTRAVPAIGQHTFWIPPEEIDTMTPRMWNIEPGTEIAAFELIEIEGWKYGEWLVELAALRKESGDAPDATAIERAIALASIEPLTSMDYHGEWLGQHMPKAGKEKELLELFRRALAAEPNPLFSRPKLGRIFNYMTNVLNRGEGSASFRADLAQLGLDSAERISSTLLMGFQSRALALAAPGKKEEMAKTFREDLIKKISDENGANAFLKSAISERKIRDDRPINECLNLLDALNDPATNKMFLEAIKDKRGDGIEASDRTFATIALEASQIETKGDEKWDEQIAKGFAATEKSNSPDVYMRWPAVLGDYLTARNPSSETVLKLRQAALARVLKAGVDDGGRLPESLRAGSLLIETSVAQKNTAVTGEAVAALVPVIKEGSGKISEDSLRVLLKSINLLAAESPEQAGMLVAALDPDIRRFPKMVEAYEVLRVKN